MSCDQIASPDICPGVDEITDELVALLPPGRAWGIFPGGGNPADTIRAFWSAVASVFADMEQRICDLRDEFFCPTVDDTRDLWLADYGLPDACDPFPDLCAKVAAIGGSRCDYFAAIALQAGWVITCVTEAGSCGADAGLMVVDCDGVGGEQLAGTMTIIVDLADSPAVADVVAANNIVDLMVTGDALACDPSIAPLVCLMARIVPAHVQVIYQT